MKDLYESILNDIDTTLADSDVKVTHILIQKYLEDNYNGNWIISEKPNKDGLYEVSSNKSIKVKNKQIISLTNDLFIWTSVKGGFNCSGCNGLESLEGAPVIVKGDFNCSDCNGLKSLEGAPKKVEGIFYCYDCGGLKSLEGAPKKVEGTFYCRNCSRLESLEGAPEEVGGGFYCAGCNSLKSLKGAPKEVGGYFDCSSCKSLKSLDGAPKEVGTYFDCSNCGKSFIEDDIKKVSKVNTNIYC